MDSTLDNGSSDSEEDDISQQARAHIIRASISTLTTFIDEEKKQFKGEPIPVYRAAGDDYLSFGEAIAALQSKVNAGSVAAVNQLAQDGYEPTRLIRLEDTRAKNALTVVYYEGVISGQRGYGVLNDDANLRVTEMEIFKSPDELLAVYGESTILVAARAIQNTVI